MKIYSSLGGICLAQHGGWSWLLWKFLLTSIPVEQYFIYVLLFEHKYNLVLKCVRTTEFPDWAGFFSVELFQKPVIPTSFFR